MTDTEHNPKHEVLQKNKAPEEHEVKEVIGFLKRYSTLIGTGILAATLTAVGSRFYAQHKADRLAAAEQALSTARTPQDLEAMVKEYGSTPSAPVALLTLAKTLFNDGDTARARTQYEQFLKKYKNHEMQPIAELGLAYCTEADGDFNGAATQFAEFSKKNTGSYLHPQAILSVARCMEQAGRIDEARIVLEDFLTEKGDSAWASLAEAALKQLTEK